MGGPRVIFSVSSVQAFFFLLLALEDDQGSSYLYISKIQYGVQSWCLVSIISTDR